MAKIENYALLGDLQTAALVSRAGSVDWCCFPRFDSGACFAALLGTPEHGRWLLAPVDETSKTERRYRPDSLILETTHEMADGKVRAIDFMPRGHAPDIVRIVEGIGGRVTMRSAMVARFDYGRSVPWVRRLDGRDLLAIAGPDALCFRTPAELQGEDMVTISNFTIDAGERVAFMLAWFPSHEPAPDAVDPDLALSETEAFWHEWASGCRHVSAYHEEIHRSLLVLKALTYQPTSDIVAAPRSRASARRRSEPSVSSAWVGRPGTSRR